MLNFTNSRGVVGWFTYRNNWNDSNPPPTEQEGILFPALDDGCIHLGSVTTIISLRLGEKLGFYLMDVNVSQLLLGSYYNYWNNMKLIIMLSLHVHWSVEGYAGHVVAIAKSFRDTQYLINRHGSLQRCLVQMCETLDLQLWFIFKMHYN